MSFGEILLSGVLQVLFWVGAIILTGVIIALLNGLFYRAVGTNSYKVCIATGCIGTPIHELGHAFFCLVFGHKIVEMKLFSPDKESGTVGYVKHSFNEKNIYQRMGQFFIGVGPIIFGSGVLLLLLFLLVRPAFTSLATAMSSLGSAENSLGDYFTLIGSGFGGFFRTLFSGELVTTWQWWVMLLLGCMIAIHMNLSKADIDGAKLGLLLVIAIFALVPIIVGIISSTAHWYVTTAMTSAAIYVMCVYALAIIFASISVAIVFLIRLFIILVKKILRRG
ncbi:MAG: hypothetical protein IJU10_02530 [Clostridia bacterium]|nr:hypothetical protein [Clostridia bacterium]